MNGRCYGRCHGQRSTVIERRHEECRGNGQTWFFCNCIWGHIRMWTSISRLSMPLRVISSLLFLRAWKFFRLFLGPHFGTASASAAGGGRQGSIHVIVGVGVGVNVVATAPLVHGSWLMVLWLLWVCYGQMSNE